MRTNSPLCRLLLLVLVLLAAGSTVPAAPAQAPSRREHVAAQRKQMEAAFAPMPKLAESRVKDVFTLRMVNKGLVCDCPLLSKEPLRQGQMRAALDEIEHLTSVQVSRIPIGGRQGPSELRTFVLTVYDYSDPEVVTTTSVQSQPYYFHIERQSQLPDGYRSVRLMQQGTATAGPPGNPDAAAAGAAANPRNGRVQFTVIQTTNGAAPPVSINLEAPDFYTLLRTYPREAEQYLRPVFRQVGQESVFSPDPLLAWQVFADQWKADERVGRAVRALLPGLDHTDFRTRDAASKKLAAMGRDAAAVLLHLDRTALTPEQNMRVDRALAPYTQLPAKEAKRLGNDRGFLLDCLYGEDPALRTAALNRLRAVAGRSIEFDVHAEPAKRSDAVAALRKQLTGAARPPAKS